MKNLVIFDFSGTLSLGAVNFTQERSLLQTFKDSGLWRIGLRHSELFWNEIVEPGWKAGSTTSIGYAHLLYDHLYWLFPTRSPNELHDSAIAFTEAYFRSSTLEREWLPLLRELLALQETTVLVATDHYAEASPHITRQCRECGLNAEVLTAEGIHLTPDKIYIANSADLGAVKADARFWEILQERLSGDMPKQILLIDDFGANEAAGDSYGAEQQVNTRCAATETLLKDVFGCAVQIFPFTVQMADDVPPEEFREKFRRRITETEHFVKEMVLQ